MSPAELGNGSPQNGEVGLIFDIQRFSIHDGPGIRTTVFLKGCPLTCLWCANPESQGFVPELMVRDINCRGCGECISACSQGAVYLAADGKRIVDRQRCNNCLQCVPHCRYQSLTRCGSYMSVNDVLTEVLRDKAFYINSGGGVTVSGGESLCQGRYTKQLLKACKEAGLHTALDTSGYAAWKVIERVLPYLDLLLFDIKHLDTAMHKIATGAGNELILENLAKATRIVRTWLRIPIIPSFNDTEEHISRVAALARSLEVEKISLLPYHEGGKGKCEQLGRPYPLPDARAPDEPELLRLKGIVEKEGVTATVGY